MENKVEMESQKNVIRRKKEEQRITKHSIHMVHSPCAICSDLH